VARFLRATPAFVIELRSESDRMSTATEKKGAWIANGVGLGWLIDLYARPVHVFDPGNPERVESGDAVNGSGPVDGFVLDLTEVWRCYE
jgi:Uma2 family endonuclease